MKKFYKKTTISIDGFEGNEIESISYMLSEKDNIKNDEPLTQQDVVEADQVFDNYNKYENLGEIDDDEIKILRKFNIL